MSGKVKSIVQLDEDRCFLCGTPARWDDPLDTHHCFGGALRKKSDREGLTVKLHHITCHQFSPSAVHNNKGNMLYVKQQAQIAWQDYYGRTTKEFIQEYGKNYL